MFALVSMLRSTHFGRSVSPTALIRCVDSSINQADCALRLCFPVKRLAKSGHRGGTPHTGDKTNDSYAAGLDRPQTRWTHCSF